MTQTAALTQEERAEIRALAGPLHDTARQINRAINDAPAEVNGGHAAACQDAADALPRLLDALEAAERERDAAQEKLAERIELYHAEHIGRTQTERERDRLAEANWKGATLLNNARDTLAIIAGEGCEKDCNAPCGWCLPCIAQRELDAV
jgi:hypothetical protein